MRMNFRTTASCVFSLLSACSSPPSPSAVDAEYTSKSGDSDDVASVFGASSAAIGIEVPSCSVAGQSGFVSASGVLTITLSPSSTTEVVLAPVGNALRVNGRTCVDGTGAAVDLSKVSKLVVTGTSGDDAVILDYFLGTFGAKLSGSAGGGIALNLGAGAMDRVGIRGSIGIDTMIAGTHTGRAFMDFTGDASADLVWVSTATRREFMVASAGGNDFISGSGRSIAAVTTPLSANAALAGSALSGGAIGALSADYTFRVYGGPGNDKIQGGDGNDFFDGGEGDDTFLVGASRDGADVFLGGPGSDTVEFSARAADLTLSLAPGNTVDANDGELGEGDDLTSSIENLTGGSGNDKLVGNSGANILRGGPGNDTLNGGGAGTCTVDTDVLYGNDGDDLFEMNAASDCGDEVFGGAGKDVATYHDRNAPLTVSRDEAANDGEPLEKDNIHGDIEVLVGGQAGDTLTGGALAGKLLGCGGDDLITGSSADDELSGGPGNDVVSGGAGNDVFLESGDEPLCYSGIRGITSSLRGTGSDVLNGGAGVEDKMDYGARTAALTITLCVDAATATGLGTVCVSSRNDGESGENDDILNMEVVESGSGNDTITGAAADEWIYGNAGNDVIDGAGGNDHLDGGPGSNTLAGGTGSDICQNYTQATSCDLHIYTCNAGTKRDCDRTPENACEADVAVDVNNCGGCGVLCASGQACISGACVSAFSSTTSGMVGDGLNNCGPSGNDDCGASPLVTGGTFYRGTDTANPATISDFRLDKYEVTVGRFRKFVDAWVGGWRPGAGSGKHTHLNSGSGLTNTAGGYEPGWDATWASYPGAGGSGSGSVPSGTSPTTVAGWTANLSCDSTYQTWTSAAGANERRPQNCLSFYDLHAFCIWDGGFLPSEAEWEYAAAGGSEERTYPWGATVPAANSNLSVYGCYWNGTGSCTGVTNIATVGSVTAGNGKWGQSDLAGNIWEWNLDWYNSFATTCNNCANVTASSDRVNRGGSFGSLAFSLPAASRNNPYPATRNYFYGGRCARTAP